MQEMSITTTAVSSGGRAADRRRSMRHPLAVPIEVSVLRSGVPDTIPGRVVDVSEGGLSVILAGELHATQTVAVDFRLSEHALRIRARALVRHQQLLHYGLEFLGLTDEQLESLRIWARSLHDSTSAINSAPLDLAHMGRRGSSRWLWILILFAAVVLGAALWWHWQQGWRQLEKTGAQTSRLEDMHQVPVLAVQPSSAEHQI